MTSNDNQQYITVELFNSKMETFMTQIKLGNEQLRNELNSKIDGVQSTLNSKIDGVQSTLNSKIDSVQSTLNSKINSVQSTLNSKIDSVQSGLRSEMQQGFNDLHNEIRTLDTNIQVNSTKIEMLNHTFYWGFALMTLILTFVAVFVPHFISERKEKKNKEEADKIQKTYTTRDEVLQLIREVIANTTGNIGTVGK